VCATGLQLAAFERLERVRMEQNMLLEAHLDRQQAHLIAALDRFAALLGGQAAGLAVAGPSSARHGTGERLLTPLSTPSLKRGNRMKRRAVRCGRRSQVLEWAR
jgi:hypothetical protein